MPSRSRISRKRLLLGLTLTVVAVGLLIADRVGQNDDTVVVVTTTVPTTTTLGVTTTLRPVFEYQVLKGEGLFDIATRFGLTTKELATYNQIADPNDIQTDDVLKIPPPLPTSSTVSTLSTGPTTTLPVATTLPDDPPTSAPPPTQATTSPATVVTTRRRNSG